MGFVRTGNAPHLKHSDNTAFVMRDVLIALIPAFVWGIYIFGFRALAVCLVSVASCVAAEAGYCLARKRPISVFDLSSTVMGMILGLCYPVSVPLWVPVIGGAVSVAVGKVLFDFVGKKLFNPAVFGYLVSSVLFSSLFKLYETPSSVITGAINSNDLTALFLGDATGGIGEVSAVMLLLGFAYLLLRRVIAWNTAVAFVGTVFVLRVLFPGGENEPVYYAVASMLSGGVLFAAVFTANDYGSTPVTYGGRLLFGLGCGVLSFVLVYLLGFTQGVAAAILVMNLTAPLLDRAAAPVPFGGNNSVKKK